MSFPVLMSHLGYGNEMADCMCCDLALQKVLWCPSHLSMKVDKTGICAPSEQLWLVSVANVRYSCDAARWHARQGPAWPLARGRPGRSPGAGLAARQGP